MRYRERARRSGGGEVVLYLLMYGEQRPEKRNNLPEVSQEPSGRLNPDHSRPKAKSSLQDYRDSQRIGGKHTKPKPAYMGVLYIQAWNSH